MHSNEEGVETKLCRIAEKARTDVSCQFTSLFHLMTAEMMQAIYEQDFIDDSYGFRRMRGRQDALGALSCTVEQGAVNDIVEADIHGFLDHVNQDTLMMFLSHRIAGKRMLRYTKRFLKAGYQ